MKVTSCTYTSKLNKAMFRPWSLEEEKKIMNQFRNGDGLDEDVKMLEIACKRLKENRDHLVKDVHWAHYPSDILSHINNYISYLTS